MNFTSPVFFIFLPVVVLLYFVLPYRFRWVMLLAASYMFYAWYNVWLLLLVMTTTLVSYICALKAGSATTRRGRNAALAVAVIICIGILFIFKYLNFAIQTVLSVAALLGAEPSFTELNIILPMGISFYTFQTMSYVIDVCRGDFPPEKHLGYYALFVVFFPQLVAGPIERPSALLPQLKEKHDPNISDMAEGAVFLISGYAKKLIVADLLAAYVDSVYGNVAEANGLALTVATVMFALQIYCDFAGYSEIAVGCARLMGIKLSRNFNRPYSATNIRDFWRRWHISLTTWFKDYLYIPLGGNRKGYARQLVNTMIVFLVSGLWHGANLTFVIWGGLHGAYILVYSLWKKLCEAKNITLPAWLSKYGGCALTFLLVTFAWIFFRAQSVNEAAAIISRIFTDWSGGTAKAAQSLGIELTDILPCLLAVIMLPFTERIPRIRRQQLPLKECSAMTDYTLLYFILCLTLFVAWCYTLSVNGDTNFIYFSF